MSIDDGGAPALAFRDWRLLRLASRGDVDITERAMMRRGQLVVSDAAAAVIGDLIGSDYGGERDPEPGPMASLGFQRWTIAMDRPVLDVVAELRAALGDAADEPDVVVSPHYLLSGEPKYAGGPGGAPRPKDQQWEPAAPARRVFPDVAVLDTGVPSDLAALHPLLATAVRHDPNDRDELYRPGTDELLSEAGHGTFIAGLVIRMAPDLVVDVGEVLDPEGIGDDASVANELLETTAAVVNLSLGGYTEDDQPPPLLAAALARVLAEHPDRVVVAAAGNDASERPFWPAALAASHDNIASVAAGDVLRDGTVVAADFSNRGDWVVASTYGVDIVSTYVVGTYPGPGGPAGFHDFPFATWDGTSFAAPILAAAIAARARESGVTPAAAWATLRSQLAPAPPGLGGWFEPPVDPRTF